MSYESVVEHMRRELVAGATRRRRRERIHRSIGALVVAAALVVGAVALTRDDEQATHVSTEPTELTAEARTAARAEACNDYLDLAAFGAAPGPSTTAALEQIAALATTSGDETLASLTATIRDKYPKTSAEITTEETSRELGNAYRELRAHCRAIGVPGLNPVYVPAALGPEPHVDLSAYGTEQRLDPSTQLPERATAPEGRGLSAVVVAASAEGAYVMMWSYQPATADSPAHCRTLGTTSGSNTTCGPSNDPKSAPVTGLAIRQAAGTTFRDATSIEVPNSTTFVVLDAPGQRLVQRPVAGIAIFVWQPIAPATGGDITVRAYDSDGRVLECVASGTGRC